jgi:hypothetical protein
MRLQLNFAAGNYDFVRPLAEGSVKADGIDLVVLAGMGVGRAPSPHGRGREFDICEFSAAAYLAARDRDLPWTALPVFLHRRFRHGFVFVNPARGIKAPADLRGKRDGGPTFSRRRQCVDARHSRRTPWCAAPRHHLGDRARGRRRLHAATGTAHRDDDGRRARRDAHAQRRPR